jgi:protein KTI12
MSSSYAHNVKDTDSSEVHIGTPADKARELHRARIETDQSNAYPEADFENLIYRYEEPNGMTRWDSPLFTVLYEDETPPFEQLWEAMIGSGGQTKVVRPNAATVLVRVTQIMLFCKYAAYRSTCSGPQADT